MESLIILDYRNGVVGIIPINWGANRPTSKDYEEIIEEWAGKNNTTLKDCNWMAWNGNIKITPLNGWKRSC